MPFLRFQAILNMVLVWMVSVLPLILISSSPLFQPLGAVLSAPTIIFITFTPMIYSPLSSLERFLFSLSFIYSLWLAGTAKLTKLQPFFFFFFFLMSIGLVFCPEIGDLFASQNPGEFYISFFKTNSTLCKYHLIVWSNLLHISKWITLPTQLYLVLYLIWYAIWKVS